MIKTTKLSEDELIQLDYERAVQHILFFGSSSSLPTNAELREDGTYELREDGDYELRE